MAVSVSVPPELTFFVPQAELGSPFPIGKWAGYAQVTNDNSGGVATHDIVVPNVATAEQFMWSLEDWQFTDSPGPAAGTEGILTWETGDPIIVAGVPVVLVWRQGCYVPNPAVATMNGSVSGNDHYRFRYVARPKGFVIRWRFEWGNTNLHITQFEAWGYLWHQEIAKAGPVQRPQD